MQPQRSSQGMIAPPNPVLIMTWGEHVPAQKDWMKYIILLHPAMQDIVTAEIAKRAVVAPAEENLQ